MLHCCTNITPLFVHEAATVDHPAKAPTNLDRFRQKLPGDTNLGVVFSRNVEVDKISPWGLLRIGLAATVRESKRNDGSRFDTLRKVGLGFEVALSTSEKLAPFSAINLTVRA